MEYEKIVLICENSMEGIFSAVYDGWKLQQSGKNVEISIREPDFPDFFTSIRPVTTDQEKAGKVMRTVSDKLGHQVYEAVCYTAVSCHPRKGTIVFRVLWQAISGKKYDRRIMENLANPEVNLASKLRIKVWHELHRYYGFVRFREIGGRVLFSQITPENDILELLAPHFSDRFPNEDWMIYDENRKKVLLHPKGKPPFIQNNAVLQEDTRKQLAEKEEYEELWRHFCRSVTIQERKNPGLQQQLLPLKFRGNMPEFCSHNKTSLSFCDEVK